MGVQIVYTSRTGNTEKLAEAVFAAVPQAAAGGGQ